jgi:single-stranded DNA-specific DHH superfamily exonuclease
VKVAYIDLFNGDADGICALVQLRNAEPLDSTLITGVKRDIQLLDKIACSPGDRLTVLDISLDKNRSGLERALAAGAEVFYVDHHFAGDIPSSKQLTTLINTASDVCTSILVNQHLGGQYVEWAVVGAFGDNLRKSAQLLAKPLGLSESQIQKLENLGIYINYNGYGASIEDLHFPPDDLFSLINPFEKPEDFMNSGNGVFEKLESGYHQDMSKAQALQSYHQTAHVGVYVLPNAAWARRVSGVYSNELANAAPARAHAVLTEREQGGYVVSVRAPIDNKVGADELCRRFPTGGGRKAAAGINDLPFTSLDDFIRQFADFYAS